ncbi:uncharacterized protein LOC107042307 [Diachasma alloeum]|uniref:uncharacterized protein LOC107042307 n=1 Tax=Diachasma alloeum TaxID=454923 RepID=UPI000738411F|nr:uncharacterized protein LOC107042307 [Diachasma alloeum]
MSSVHPMFNKCRLLLKENNHLVILPADKGNARVVMDKGDYSGKHCAMLGDSRVYTKLRKDPIRTIERQSTDLLKMAGLSADLTKFLTPKESFPPRLYGLPKIHKASVPLRPINSLDFVNKLKNLRTSPDDILVSFDAESLCTNVPIPETLFEGELYEKKSGAAMCSPISPIIANIFMEHFENEVLKSAAQKPNMWFRYVDATFVIWPHGRSGLNQFLEFLNAQHPSIKFTMGIEQNGCLPFLDVLVLRNKDVTLAHQVYRKPTHTDRALTISQPSNVNSEIEHLGTALTKNRYNLQPIQKVKGKLQSKLSSPQEEINPEENQEKIKVVLIPYLGGTTERISRVLGKHNIRTIFQPPKKIEQTLPSAKDPRPPLSTPGVNTNGIPNTVTYNSLPFLLNIAMDAGHSIEYDQARMLAKSPGYFERKYREGLEIYKNPNNIDRDRGYQVNPIWKTIPLVF